MQQPLPLPEFSSPGSLLRLPASKRIYCNRNLRLDQIELIGFDMDYTLAIYRQQEIDRLSIRVTVEKLVERGYPEQILDADFPTDFPIRGLLIDRRLGNVLKMDRYRYVKNAYHGLRPLTREERRRAYHTRRLRPATQRYHWVDTLYGLSEVAVYAAVVEALEAQKQKIDFDQLFQDIRACADLSHQDDSILGPVRNDLARYVEKDPLLGRTLHKLRSAGKRLFLLTNSAADYTEAMMSYLFDDALPEYPTWRHYFDYVVTKASKPGFFTKHEPFYEVNDPEQKAVNRCERNRIYRGGNIFDLQKSFGTSGDRILYIGDHIFGDVLRAKKDSAWRTAMIVQEMDGELATHASITDLLSRVESLDELRSLASDELREQQLQLKTTDKLIASANGHKAELEATRLRHRRAIDKIRARLKQIDEELAQYEQEIDDHFHPYWGSIFKAGNEVSSFGDQVEEYACLYTARVSNFVTYSPVHYFESPRDLMPHEL